MASLSKNSFFNFFSQIATFLSSLLLSVFLARLLGPEQMGHYSFWMWLIGTGSLLLTLGLPRALTRFIAHYHSDDEAKVKQIITRSFLFGNQIVILILVVLLTLTYFANDDQRVTYIIVIFNLAAFVLNNILGSYLAGLQKYNLLLRISLFVSPISLVMALIILMFFRNLNNLLALNFLISLASISISYYYLKDYFNFKIDKLPANIYQEISKYAFSTSLIVFLDLVLMERSEVFFLKQYSALEQVAFYSLAFGLVNRAMILIPGAISGVIMPRVASLYGDNNLELINKTYHSSTRYLILVTFPIIFAGVFLVDLVISFLYGPSYMEMVPVIRILLISGGLSAIVAAASSVLYGIGRQDFILKLGALAALLNITLDILLIPIWGAIGAAYANSAAQILGVIVGTYYLVKVKKMVFPLKETIKILIMSISSILLIYFVRLFMVFDFPFIILLTLGILYSAFYIFGLVLLRFFDQRDFDILERFVQRVPFNNFRNLMLFLLRFTSKNFKYEI